MPEIQNPEIVRNIEKRYGLKGYPGPGILSPEIVPVTLVDDLTDEFNVERHPYAGYATQLGAGGEYGTVQLYNQPSSGKIIEIDTVWVNVSTNQGYWRFRVSNGVSYAAASTQTCALDGRSSTLHNAQMRHESVAGQITAAHLIRQEGIATTLVAPPVILDEADSFIVQSNTAADTIFVSIVWRERPRTVEDANIP